MKWYLLIFLIIDNNSIVGYEIYPTYKECKKVLNDTKAFYNHLYKDKIIKLKLECKKI